GADVLEERGEFRPRVRRRASRGAREGRGRSRDLHSGSLGRGWLRRLRPHRHWRRRTHAALHRSDARGAMRRGLIDRRTTETQIVLSINLDGGGRYQVRTGIRFFDHMLELVARHGAFDLRLEAKGDLDVDQHHTVEDVGIAFGEAVSKALGDRRGINRAGYFVMPMDETLAVAAVDLSGRPHAVVDLQVKVARVGDLQTELVHDF